MSPLHLDPRHKEHQRIREDQHVVGAELRIFLIALQETEEQFSA
jgi:hypothetical protein